MATVIATVVVDRSQVYVIQGVYEWQRDPSALEGVLIPPHGSAFPTTTTAHEMFWRDDQMILYKRNAGNTAWDALTSAPTAHSSTHLPGGSDPLTTAIAITITDSTNGVGTANSFSRSDHQHAHGNRGGGTLHAIATPSLAGFLSASDKSKLDNIESGAEVNDVDSVFGRTGAVVAEASDYDADQVDYDNTASELSATDTQAAIDEIAFPRLVGYANSNGISTTTSTTFQTKVTLNAGTLVAGTYKLITNYGWNHDATDSDFEARVLNNGAQLGELHKQEPKSSAGGDPTGSTQRYYCNRQGVFALPAGARTFVLQYRTDDAADESSIWEASLELWRYA